MSNASETTAGSPLIELRGVSKIYRKGAQEVRALDGVDLEIAPRGMVAIVGPSGSGKSSLLHVIGAMDRPTGGDAIVAGSALHSVPEAELTRFRRQTVGFVFQSFNLIPNLSALENVMLPLEFNGVGSLERRQKASALLERLGLAARFEHRPSELSGGEQQRVAIARALANDAPLIVADEPTGNLDSVNGRVIYELLRDIARERTVVIVSHAETLAEMSDRVLHIRDGRLA